MSEFPQRNVGVVRGTNAEDEEYEVHWIEKDLAYLTIHGDIIFEFCSKNSGGFSSLEDLIEQSQAVVTDQDY